MEPVLVSMVLCMSLVGAGMGLFSGIAPGIHANTLASLMLVAYPALESVMSGIMPADDTAIAVCCCIMSAGVVHSFIDFVPSVFIGAPDSEDALSVLPGHRLLLKGEGMVAVRAAAIGSLIGCSVAIILSIPFQYVLLNGAEQYLERLTPLVLVVASSILVMNEGRRGIRQGVLGGMELLLSGALGYCCMTLPIPCTGILGEGTLLFPLLTGLFGIPVLLESSQGNGRIPPQRDDVDDPTGLVPGLKGVVTGCIAGWFPGITSTVGASISSCFTTESRPERFISTVASIGTVTSVLSLVTLSVSGSGRSGTAIVIGEIVGDGLQGLLSEGFLLLLLSTAVASISGYALTIWSGRVMGRVVSRVDQRSMGRAVMVLLIVLTILMTGPGGVLVLIASVILGFLPQVCGTSRTVLCGCLILPVLLF